MNLKHLTKKVVKQNYQVDEPVENVVFKKFERVTRNTVLGLVSRILEIEEFVAVIDEDSARLTGVITHIQLLNFVASASIVNGTKNLKI